jgi:hypothetical protein
VLHAPPVLHNRKPECVKSENQYRCVIEFSKEDKTAPIASAEKYFFWPDPKLLMCLIGALDQGDNTVFEDTPLS